MIDTLGLGRMPRRPSRARWSLPRARTAIAGSLTPSVAALAMLALCGATPAFAQAQSSSALPDTTPLPLVGDSAPAYLTKFGRLDNALRLGDQRYQIVLAAAPSAAQLDADRRRGAPMDVCPPLTAPAAMPEDADRIVGRNAADLLVVVATATRGDNGTCQTRWNTTLPAVWRAAFYPDSGRRSAATPFSLELEADGRPVAPVASASRPAYEWRAGTWVRAGSQLRYYYDMGLLASRANGGMPSLTVRVWGNASASASSFALPQYGLERLADEYQVWRFATREEAPGLRAALQPRRPVPGTLASALAEARDGRVVRGALAASTYLVMARYPDSAYEQGVARALLADAEYRLGDPTRARSLVTEMHRSAPCLRLPTGAVAELQAFADSLANGRCETQPLRRIAIAGLTVPGGAHYAAGSRLVGGIATGIVSSLFIGALLQERSARAHYARYASAATASDAYFSYQMATDARARARSTAVSAVVAWLLDDLLAVAGADARNRRIVRDRL